MNFVSAGQSFQPAAAGCAGLAFTGKGCYTHTNPKHYFVQSGERFSFLARSRSAGIAALFQAESDTARGEKIRRDDKRMFGSGINAKSNRKAASAGWL
jgi:23S rRNA maturation mini-RNase III